MRNKVHYNRGKKNYKNSYKISLSHASIFVDFSQQRFRKKLKPTQPPRLSERREYVRAKLIEQRKEKRKKNSRHEPSVIYQKGIACFNVAAKD